MTATPGTPDDWTDTNPESTAPERILPTPEDVTPSATKVAMVCYAVGAASKCWEHPERAGVFDSDRASQIVTELCVALGMEQQGDTAPESARAATLTPEQPVKAPGQGGDLLLTRGKPVEVEWPNGYRLLRYFDEGGYQLIAGHVGNGTPHPWGVARIVRVLTEDKPAQEPVLPRPITPTRKDVPMTDTQPTDQGAEDLIPDDAGLTPPECPHHFDCDGIRCDPGVSDVPSSAPARVELEETITDPAEIRATDDPDERTTPAPVGAAVALDLDAARAMLNAANTIKATGGAVEIGGVRIEPCDEYGSTVTTARAEAAEAEVVTLRAKVKGLHEELLRDDPEVVTLRAKVAAVEALTVDWPCSDDTCDGDCTGCAYASDLRAALAVTTGEGQ